MLDSRHDPIIEAKHVGRTFGRRHVLSDISFEVGSGQIFGIVGADGAGKTTLLQVLAAILDPTEGHCRVIGFDTRREADAITSRIGYMAQGFTLYERLSVAENIAFSANIRGLTESQHMDRRRQLLKMAGLSQFLDRREGQLSGGMRKKLALCTNLIHQPPLLVLDEPSLGVDPLSRSELWEMLRGFRKEGATIVFSTSYMDEADTCDRVALLDDGQLIAVGTPSELTAEYRGLAFLLVSRNPAKAYAILQEHRAVIGTQWRSEGVRFQLAQGERLPAELASRLEPLGSLRSTKPTIEDVFVIEKGRSESREAAPSTLSASGVPAGVASRTTTAPPVVAQGLTRRFGRFVAVDNVSLEVRSGEILGLLGPNGAGKTTLIRMLCGLLPASDGKARVAGFDPTRDSKRVRSRIGYMSQRFSLYPDLTVGENMWFFARAYGMSRDVAQSAIGWTAEVTDLKHLMHERGNSLSGALRQRLALACSVLHRPNVLFLDEPTSGVDPLSRYRFWHLIGELARQGMTIVVTTHYLAEAVYCHRLGLMHEGRLIAVGDLPALRLGLGETAPESIEAIFIAYMEKERKKVRTVPAARGGS